MTTAHVTGAATDEDAATGRVYDVAGEDWDSIVSDQERSSAGEQIVVNMGPQHPSTHGVLRLVLTLEGETVTEARASIGYLHTGIEKSMEYRTWTQGTTFITRADYLMPIFNETAYCLAVERLLGIEDKIPERAKLIRVLLLELNRIASHLGGIGPFGLELGATTIFLQGVRMRENILDVFELITGLRMNHAFVRPGGVAQDLTPGHLEAIRAFLKKAPKWTKDLHTLIDANPVFKARTKGIAFLDLQGCMSLGVTGPILRATGLPWDLRKSQPYLDYETFDFEVPTTDTCDAYGRYVVRMAEIDQSLRIISQCVDRLSARDGSGNDPWLIQDAKVGWPARLSLGPDGMGPSPEHIAHIMGQSMEALIHHFKLVTEGFRVPAGQAYVPIESAKGEIGCHVVSDGGTRPYRAHLRDPSFHHLQAVAVLCEGGNLADVIPAIASIDPVIGGVDR
ncbi:MAG TPA: NADH-quinone oxidoreductase subunit D [Trebonia sp.]|nr:NADH-quinone oxidoreductase subunit D [Trebonia sp.]